MHSPVAGLVYGLEVLMGKLLRRIRGGVVMGFIWGAAWGVVGSVPHLFFGVNTDAPLGLVFGVFGFIAGVIFSALLVLTEGRRRFDQMSLPRFAAWGALGGLLLSSVFVKAASLALGDALVVVPTFAIASAVCASASLALARRAAGPQLPGGNGDITERALTSHETPNLPRAGN